MRPHPIRLPGAPYPALHPTLGTLGMHRDLSSPLFEVNLQMQKLNLGQTPGASQYLHTHPTTGFLLNSNSDELQKQIYVLVHYSYGRVIESPNLKACYCILYSST